MLLWMHRKEKPFQIRRTQIMSAIEKALIEELGYTVDEAKKIMGMIEE